MSWNSNIPLISWSNGYEIDSTIFGELFDLALD